MAINQQGEQYRDEDNRDDFESTIQLRNSACPEICTLKDITDRYSRSLSR